MIVFKTSFEPDTFEKSIINRAKESIESKLARTDISALTVILTKDAQGTIRIVLEGITDAIETAKRVLKLQ